MNRRSELPSSLVDYSRAQHAEDLVLAELIGMRRNGIFVEAGALDGERLSNTWLFEKALDWSGLLVEPIPHLAARCRDSRSKSIVVEAALGREAGTVDLLVPKHAPEFAASVDSHRVQERFKHSAPESILSISVPRVTLDFALREAGIEHIDLLVLDVEGAELEVLRGFSLARFSPALVMLERNELLDVRIVARLLAARYQFVCSVAWNDIWAKADSRIDVLAGVPRLMISAVVPTGRYLIRRGLRLIGLLHAVRRLRAKS